MYLGELIYDGEYTQISNRALLSQNVSGVSSHSADIRPGWVFVCFKGTKTDGSCYISDAIGRGASVIVCEDSFLPADAPFVRVKNPRKMLSLMLHRFWDRSAEKMKLFAVTGTNGKTSTLEYLKGIFICAGQSTATVGTLKCTLDNDKFYLGGNDDDRMSTMTTPDPEQLYKALYEMHRKGAKNVIIEASSHALSLEKLAPLRFDCGIFTNFSSEHLDFHHELDGYLSSKAKLFSMSEKMFINSDDPSCLSVSRNTDTPCVYFGINNSESEYRAEDIHYFGVEGISYTLCSNKYRVPIKCRCSGEFSVYNTLAAGAVALDQGVEPELISKALCEVERVEGRFEKIYPGEEHGDFSVFIDYAHTERAMEKLLCSVQKLKRPDQRIVTVFGCGGERDRTKRAPMGSVASRYSDLVIITEDNSRGEDVEAIISDIMLGIDKTKPHLIIKNRKKAIEYAIKQAITGDIILLVGKGHENYEITRDGKVPFSEKRIVYQAMKEKWEK